MSEVSTQYFVGNTEIIQSYLGDNPVLFNPIKQLANLEIEYLIVGGGGGIGALMPPASQSVALGGAGGGGGLLSGSVAISEGIYEIIVGSRGSNGVFPISKGSQGGNSSFLSQTAFGGGGGGTPTLDLKTGGDGGSGGGAAYFSGSYTPGGSGSVGPPIQGYNGYFTTGEFDGGGSGGGASAASLGLPGSGSIWLDGVEYSRGGVGQYRGGVDSTNPGAGGGFQSTASGSNGIVKLRYIATASIATGGTIQITGSYVYHIFNTPGTSSLTFL